MQTKFARQAWGFDPRWIRVEALDEQDRPLGYVYFVPRSHRPQPRAGLAVSRFWFFPQFCRELVLTVFSRACEA